MTLAVVRDLRDARAAAGPEELAGFETDVLAGFVLASAAKAHLPDWPEVVTSHVLRHFCASQLYLSGMDLLALQATLL